MPDASHWNDVYARREIDDVSWYTPRLERSLELIESTGAPKSAAVIDVGGGASTLARDLLERGWTDVTVLDISENALAEQKRNLGADGERVSWIVGDITTVELPAERFDIWHDRAVFHFLTDEEDRAAYIRQVLGALKPGGFLIVATFGPEGPDKCSNLPVKRYDDGELVGTFGEAFERIGCVEEQHVTPKEKVQEFVYCMCRKR